MMTRYFQVWKAERHRQFVLREMKDYKLKILEFTRVERVRDMQEVLRPLPWMV